MAENKKSRKKILPIIIGIILIAGLGYGVKTYIYSLHHEDTDDAQIDGDISPVVSRVTGYVDTIFFEENQHVAKGSVLIKLDERDLQIKVEQAQAALDNAIAGVSVTKANVGTAQAASNSSQANVDNAKIKVWQATQDFNRYQNLLNDHSITQQQFDNAKAAKESAEAQLRLAEKQLTTGQVQVNATSQQISVSQSMITAKQADLDYAKLQLSYATIIAPISGFTSKKSVQSGQLVQAGQTLLNVVSDSDIYITANFKETQLDKMKKGQAVSIKVDAFPKAEISGTVYSFSPATGARFSLLPPDNASGNFVKVIQRLPVKIKIRTSKETAQLLHPGMSVRASVNIE